MQIMTLNHLRAYAWRMRHFLLALVAIAVLGAVLETVASVRPNVQTVLVTANEVSAGSTLDAANLTTADVPAHLVPEGALSDISEAEGEVITASLPAGMPISESLLLSNSFFDTAPEGHVIMPIEAASNAAAELISSGDSVALYAPPDEHNEAGEAQLVTKDATVMGLATSTTSGGLLGSDEENLTFFVALPERETSHVLGASARSPLLVVAQRSTHISTATRHEYH